MYIKKHKIKLMFASYRNLYKKVIIFKASNFIIQIMLHKFIRTICYIRLRNFTILHVIWPFSRDVSRTEQNI